MAHLPFIASSQPYQRSISAPIRSSEPPDATLPPQHRAQHVPDADRADEARLIVEQRNGRGLRAVHGEHDVFSDVPGVAQNTCAASSGCSSTSAQETHTAGLPSRSAAATSPSASTLKRVVLRPVEPDPAVAGMLELMLAAHDVPRRQHRQRIHVGDEVAHIVVGGPAARCLPAGRTARCARPP